MVLAFCTGFFLALGAEVGWVPRSDGFDPFLTTEVVVHLIRNQNLRLLFEGIVYHRIGDLLQRPSTRVLSLSVLESKFREFGEEIWMQLLPRASGAVCATTLAWRVCRLRRRRHGE